MAEIQTETLYADVDPAHARSQYRRVGLVEYRLQQHETRLEAQNAQLDRIEAAIGELRVSVGRIEVGLSSVASSVSGLRATTIRTGLGEVALVAAVLVLGQTWFGVSTRDIINSTVIAMRQQAAPVKPQG